MLQCIYHPIHAFRVVEHEEADRLIAEGFWFDTPTKAKQYREQVENNIRQEAKKTVVTAKPKRKLK